jgi:hypothetical protein
MQLGLTNNSVEMTYYEYVKYVLNKYELYTENIHVTTKFWTISDNRTVWWNTASTEIGNCLAI